MVSRAPTRSSSVSRASLACGQRPGSRAGIGFPAACRDCSASHAMQRFHAPVADEVGGGLHNPWPGPLLPPPHLGCQKLAAVHDVLPDLQQCQPRRHCKARQEGSHAHAEQHGARTMCRRRASAVRRWDGPQSEGLVVLVRGAPCADATQFSAQAVLIWPWSSCGMGSDCLQRRGITAMKFSCPDGFERPASGRVQPHCSATELPRPACRTSRQG